MKMNMAVGVKDNSVKYFEERWENAVVEIIIS